jgi:hypothetical protein
MRKYVVLGVNDNPKYLYYLPLVVGAWKQLGWEVIIFYCGKVEFAERLIPFFRKYNIRECLKYEQYESSTISQVARLYGACVVDGLLMTSDIDMLPLSDYWKPDESKVTTYGRDLTDYHYPICYISMGSPSWREVMNINSNLYGVHLRRDMRVQKNQWVLDQDIITEKLLEYGEDKITHIDRGTDKRTGYPIGRVDRSNWHLNHTTLIDAHLPHDILTNDESYKKVCDLLVHVWPKEDFTWYLNYHEQFKKLL